MAINNSKYTLYLDESGKSKLNDTGDDFLLCGFIVEKSLHDSINTLMLNFKKKYRIPENENLHAFDLFEKEVIKNVKIKNEEISDFFDHLLNLIRMSEFKIVLFKIDKNDFRKKIEKIAKKKNIPIKTLYTYQKKIGDGDILYEILATKTILEFSRTLQEKNCSGTIIAETRNYNDEALIRGFKTATDKNKFEESSPDYKNAKQAHDLIYGIGFENKFGLSYGLEIADLFAWAKTNETVVLRHKEYSKAKLNRITNRIKSVIKILKDNDQNKVQILNNRNKLVKDRVSKAIKNLDNYKT